METVQDEIFGEMSYKYAWFKEEQIELWDTNFIIKIKASAFSDQTINDSQRNNYNQLTNDLSSISAKSLIAMHKYINENYQVTAMDEIKNLVNVTEILFKQDGTYGILCESDFEAEHGFVIIISDNYEVGIQDIFL